MSSQSNPRGPAPLILATDAQGHVTGANDGFRQQLGCSARALAARPHPALLHAVQPADTAIDLWTRLRACEPWAGRLAYRQADGEPCWLLVNAMPLRRDGQVCGYLMLHAPVSAAPTPHPPRAPVRRLGHDPAWRLRLGAAGLSALAMASGLLGGLAGTALLAHMGVCALGAAVLLGWWQVQVLRPWQRAQQQAQALEAGHPLAPAPVDEAQPWLRAMHRAALQLQSLLDELGPQVDSLRTASHALALQTDDLGQRTELAAAALQETACTVDQLRTTLQQPDDPAQALAAQAAGLSTVCEAMNRLDDSTQQNAARTDACKTAAAALALRAERLSASLRLFRPEGPG
ncbi:PAS domain-containing protein [Aquincola tertiaricarbonis]|uniref:PAS domain-containing protein n=1 Tax=Aquincola tertiaricarbonis TaxID=391953 RepID=A0ABY4S5L4_AQUTE|nr:PAS domain-containing protein [Aquincola tertiaricarbonis]URI08617.1 PAS domain-containing protein [Aquincola tertiaricarbonis]